MKLAQLQMHIIRSSFKGIARDLKEQREESMNEYTLLGDIPSSLTEKRALFRSVKEHIWKSIGTGVLSGQIQTLKDDSQIISSAQFLDASQQFQDTLNTSKLATVSDVSVGTMVVVPTKKISPDEVVYIDEKGEYMYLKDQVTSEDIPNKYVKALRKIKCNNKQLKRYVTNNRKLCITL